MQADWKRRCTYGRAHNAIDNSQGSLTCPSYTDTGPTFLYGDSDTAPLVAFYDTLGIRRTHSRLQPPASSWGNKDGMKKIIIIKFLGYLQKHKTSCPSFTISCIVGNNSWLRNDSFKIKSEDLLVASATSLPLVFISFPLSAFCDFSAIFHQISLIFGQLVDNNL